ncbi:MAG: hypothetical protein MI863_01570 [Desulfobacterales bacterium]|nr:hypothetical protein [Desulfobacterales bacterium]
MMKAYMVIALLCVWAVMPLAPGLAHNPFTTEPEQQHNAPDPIIKSRLFVKIIIWQQQLREKMSTLIREARSEKKIAPLSILVLSAFLYGVIHSAGPGHGKAVALSYIVSCKPSLAQGVLFGNLVAITHGCSGIFLVLGVKFIFLTGMSSSLQAVTTYTQMISFSLIICLGLLIFTRTLYKWIRGKSRATEKPDRTYANPVFTALAVGIIPCPGVVMVMLFAISLDLTWLGILLGGTISLGMASTVTLIVLAGMSGKAALLSLASKKAGFLTHIEHVMEASAGLLVAGLGFILLGTVL